MKIISLHVENFGKLHDLNIEFSDGLNKFVYGNGYGKTTLAVFISAVFFGFRNEGKRKDRLASERVRYYPWQGGTYGGSITFEIDGKIYRVERTFGKVKKKGADISRVIDCKTNRETDEFGDNPGPEIFHVDLESFRKTVFTGQQEIETGSTPVIDSMIGNVSEEDHDVKNYENAVKKLKEEINRLSDTEKKGKLFKIREKMNTLKLEVCDRDKTQNKILNLKESAEKIRKDINSLNSRMEKEALKRDNDKSLQNAADTLKQYDDLKLQLQETMNSRLNEEKIFTGKKPDENEIDKISGLSDKLTRAQAVLDEYTFTEDEKKEFFELKNEFRSGIPNEREIEEIYMKAKESSGDGNFYAGKRKNSSKAGRSNEKKDSRSERRNILIVMAGIILLFGAVILLKMGKTAAASAAGTAGIIVITGGIAAFTSKSRHESKNKPDYKTNYKSNYKPGYKSGYKSESKSEDGSGTPVERLKNDRQRFIQLLDKKKAGENAYKEAERVKKDIYSELSTFLNQDYLNEMIQNSQGPANQKDSHDPASGAIANPDKKSFDDTKWVKSCTDFIHDTVIKIDLIKKQESILVDKIIKLESENDINSMRKNVKIRSESKQTAATEIVALNRKKEELYRKLQYVNDDLRKSNEKLEQICESEDELAGLKSEYEEGIHRLDVLKKTSAFLRSAREEFTSEYLRPLQESFRKYYSWLMDIEDGIQGDVSRSDSDALPVKNTPEFFFDTDLNLSFLNQGMTLSSRVLSRGLEDLTELCRRMAFVEAMYGDEKPFLVFDDPFVNLDDEKYRKAVLFLERLSREYQIIYFSCSKNRNGV